MAGYAKVWTTIFTDSWFLGLPLTHRGVFLQLIVLARNCSENGSLLYRNWTGLGSILSAHVSTCRKIVSKMHEDGKIELTQNGSGVIEIKIKNYEYWQGLKDIKEAVRKSTNPAKVTQKCTSEKLTTEQNRTEQNRTVLPLPKPPLIPFQEILDDLNTRIGKRYTVTPKHQELISARWKEGHILEDFRQVHTNMIEAWKDDPKMREFLRPITLYSPKFESYLNRIGKQPLDGLSEHGRKTLLAGKEWLNESKGQD